MPIAERAAPPALDACAHCELPAPDHAPGEGPRFCCAGCRAAWALIHEHGLERYYALRAGAGPAGAPAGSSGRSYAELDDAGFQARACRSAADGLRTVELYLEGVRCSACVWLVERLPRLLPGVVEARLDLPRAEAMVRWDPSAVTLGAVARRLDALGYVPHPRRGHEAAAARRREDRAMLVRIGVAGAAAGNAMAIAFALYGGMLDGMEPEFAALFRWASLAVTLPAAVWGGGLFFRGAWTALRSGALGMDLPISLGLLAGLLHGAVNTARGSGEVYFDSVTALIFLLLVGRYLERRQRRAAADATELIEALAPARARLLEGGAARDVPIEAILPGALVEVRAGELVPADGVITSGRSALDASLLSGESRPRAVGAGDAVHAGALNLASRLEVRVLSAGEETRVGRLMRLVEEHQRRRAPIVKLADRIAGRFVAVVLALAAATLAIWLRLDPARAVDHAVALLIVTCPCALGLATPLAMSAAVGRAARAGILVKGADVLERLARPGRIWLDKTGTLTAGRLRLLRWIGDEAARPLVAAAEAHAAHPLAHAFAAGLGPGVDEPVQAVTTHGGGVTARVGERRLVVGSPEFVAARAGLVAPALARAVDELVADGLTPVLIAVDGAVVAAAGFGDPLREDAAPSVARLVAAGWRVGVLSGDHRAVVAAVGRRLGLARAECRGGMTPEDKLEIVSASRSEGPVVMVGDGVNDAAALAAAGVGVAVHGGAEAALAAADVFVARPGVARLVELVEGARRTMRVVRRNLAFSLAYNAAGVALAMGGLLDPLAAAILMPLSSLTVIASSYRARTFRPGPGGPDAP